jgi:hypothetical protein
MRGRSEPELAGGPPLDVEMIRVGKLIGVAIGGSDHEDHSLARRDRDAS